MRKALTGLYMEQRRYPPPEDAAWIRGDDHAVLAKTRVQLREYFAGQRTDFDVPLGAEKARRFSYRCGGSCATSRMEGRSATGNWQRGLGNPNASRAVGLANGRNPISIIVPCHRVIGANGSLTGYGGGIERKETLLAHERALVKPW